MITNAGARAVIRYFAGYTRTFGKTLAVGIGTTSATINDSKLNYQIYSVPVVSIGADIDNQKLVFKGSLPPELVGEIYEAGLFSQGGPARQTLASFEDSLEAWIGGTFESGVRLGKTSYKVAGATAELSVNLDGSEYSVADKLGLAMRVNDAVSSVQIRLGTSVDYYRYTITSPAVGYHTRFWTKGEMVKVGSPNWSAISKIGVMVSGGSVNLDSLVIEDDDELDTENVLISRSIITPVKKAIGVPLDIEYTLPVTVG